MTLSHTTVLLLPASRALARQRYSIINADSSRSFEHLEASKAALCCSCDLAHFASWPCPHTPTRPLSRSAPGSSVIKGCGPSGALHSVQALLRAGEVTSLRRKPLGQERGRFDQVASTAATSTRWNLAQTRARPRD